MDHAGRWAVLLKEWMHPSYLPNALSDIGTETGCREKLVGR